MNPTLSSMWTLALRLSAPHTMPIDVYVPPAACLPKVIFFSVYKIRWRYEF